MPDLDVTEILDDPDFADTIDVVRRTDTVGLDGRSTTSSTTTYDVSAIITMPSPNELDRMDIGEITGAAISIVTTFRLRASAEGVQPDQVIWDGATYTVRALDRYYRFGHGFVQAIAMSMNASTPPVN